MREIELSLALRQHVVFDELQSRVSWLLPCSKTDSKALGKTRSWDCVCDNVLAKPCTFHAFRDHCSRLDNMFAPLLPHDDLPLFPDIEGKPVPKHLVVKFIEHDQPIRGPFIARLGCSVASKVWGVSSSHPVDGALVVRCDREIRRRYTAGHHCANVPPRICVKRPSGSCGGSQEFRVVCAEGTYQMNSMFRDAFLAEVRTENAASIAPQVLPPAPSFPYVLRCGGGKIHIIANIAVNVLPVYEWRTRCGWKFGPSDHSFLQHKGQANERCSACFRRGEVDRCDESSSE